jgi:hypothetical protein
LAARDGPAWPGKQKEVYMRAKTLAAIAAVSLITASSAAAAQTAQPLSLANSPLARAGAGTSGESSLDRRGTAFYIVGAVVLGLIIWGIIELTSDNNDMPDSP